MIYSPLLIKGQVQHYQWGGQSFIPELLNIEQNHRPFAELWFGTHSKAPSRIIGMAGDLLQFIGENPEVNGGNRQGLKFLLKILDVKSCLSIQVHPDKAQAQYGFNRENLLGIGLNAFERNYRDSNHKPEIMVALNTCYLLYGFSPWQESAERYGKYPGFQSLVKRLKVHGLREFYPWLMRQPRTEIQRYLEPVLDTLLPEFELGNISKQAHEYWLAKAALELGSADSCDPGLLAMLAMNLVKVEPGNGIFQPARLPHAYLEGCNIELMANSDNVLRGGLTSKHIDIEELLAVTDIEQVRPEIIRPQKVSEGVTRYPIPEREFNLYHLSGDRLVCLPERNGASVLLNMGESCRVASSQLSLDVPKGSAVFIPSGIEVKVTAPELNCYLAC